jgi:hypothetical protein
MYLLTGYRVNLEPPWGRVSRLVLVDALRMLQLLMLLLLLSLMLVVEAVAIVVVVVAVWGHSYKLNNTAVVALGW